MSLFWGVGGVGREAEQVEGSWVHNGQVEQHFFSNEQVKVEGSSIRNMDKSSRSDPGPSPSPSLHPLGLGSQVETSLGLS